MKKAIVVASCVAALTAFTTLGASAQTPGPAGQDTMQKDQMTNGGMANGGAGSTMSKGTMSKKMSKTKAKKGSMSKSKAGDQGSDEMNK